MFGFGVGTVLGVVVFRVAEVLALAPKTPTFGLNVLVIGGNG